MIPPWLLPQALPEMKLGETHTYRSIYNHDSREGSPPKRSEADRASRRRRYWRNVEAARKSAREHYHRKRAKAGK